MQWRSQDNIHVVGYTLPDAARICMKLRKPPSGEDAGGVAPCCPARRYGGVLQAPHRGLGRSPRSQRLFDA